MHPRPERHGLLNGEARIERGVAVLEHHLHLPAILRKLELRGPDGFAVEQQFAGIRRHDLHDKAGEGRFTAAGLADDAERFALGNV
jgi:hypothetical protein